MQPILNSNKLLRFLANGCIKSHITWQFFVHLFGFESVNCDISVSSFVFISTKISLLIEEKANSPPKIYLFNRVGEYMSDSPKAERLKAGQGELIKSELKRIKSKSVKLALELYAPVSISEQNIPKAVVDIYNFLDWVTFSDQATLLSKNMSLIEFKKSLPFDLDDLSPDFRVELSHVIMNLMTQAGSRTEEFFSHPGLISSASLVLSIIKRNAWGQADPESHKT